MTTTAKSSSQHLTQFGKRFGGPSDEELGEIWESDVHRESLIYSLDEMDWLMTFFDSPKTPDSTMNLEMIDGFFAALAVAPKIARGGFVNLSQHMPRIWDSEEGEAPAVFEDEDEQAYVSSLLERHLVAVTLGVHNDKAHMPIVYPAEDDQLGQNWSAGFALGVDANVREWRPFFLGPHMESLREVVSLSVGALHANGLPDPSRPLSRERREKIVEGLPEFVRDVGRFWRNREREAEMAEFRGRKPGRNDPCPCGSGRKHKRCCGAS
jgi:uncharacterized protein